METTLIILKPDCLKKGVAGKVLDRFETAGLSVVGCKMAELSSEKLREHYAHLADKPFYPEIEQFMRSRPVLIMALRGEGAVAKVRDLIGPTDYRKAAKGTVRGDFATSIMENIVHASDSVENAAAELKRFFNPGEVFAL